MVNGHLLYQLSYLGLGVKEGEHLPVEGVRRPVLDTVMIWLGIAQPVEG